MSQYITVFMTVPSQEEAALIAKTLVEEHIAACIHMLPIRSFYNWEHQFCDDAEFLLIAKTKESVFHTRLVPTVKKLHSYQVSQITAIPIVQGVQDYLDWIDSEVTEDPS